MDSECKDFQPLEDVEEHINQSKIYEKIDHFLARKIKRCEVLGVYDGTSFALLSPIPPNIFDHIF